MVEGTTMANIGAIQLAYNRGQNSHRTLGNEKGACCISTKFRRLHTKIFKTKQTHQLLLLLIAEDLSTNAGIPRSNKPLPYPQKILTRL